MGDHNSVGFDPVIELDGVRVFHGDCRDVLAGLPDDSVDSIVTDPPYELGFMGKKWDASGIAYDLTVWGECLRVLKPGGHLLAFGGTRTWHRLAVAVEDAGFEIRDNIAWMYGSGFPKSLDVSKAIDKGQGQNKERQLQFVRWMRSTGLNASQINQAIGKSDVGSHYLRFDQPAIATADLFDKLRPYLPEVPEYIERLVAERTGIEWTAYKQREVIGQETRYNEPSGIVGVGQGSRTLIDRKITSPATSEAQQWAGWGTALKPAFEPIVVARKPLSGTVAETVLEWGTGGLNIDGSRIGTSQADLKELNRGNKRPIGSNYSENTAFPIACENRETKSAQGRWPANVILDEYTADLLDQQSGVVKSAGKYKNPGVVKELGTRGWQDNDNFLNQMARKSLRDNSYANETGGASRFFYCAKASKRDRNEGLDNLPEQVGQRTHDGGEDTRGRPLPANRNTHPTVKPTALMRYLVKLVTPPGGTVLDPFTGSGSTGKAAVLEGFQFVGVELTDDYLPIIEGRLKWAIENQDEGTLF